MTKVRGFFTGLVALGFFATNAQAAIVESSSLPVGTTIDLSGFATNSTIAATALQSQGIDSITASNRGTSFTELYDTTASFNAGRALFTRDGTGEIIVLNPGDTVDFGSPIFTIDFTNRITEFGLRFADTSSDFATPRLEFFDGSTSVGVVGIGGTYDARNEFGFARALGFTRVVVDVDTNSGFQDGVGIASLTIGSAAVVPVPGAGILMAGALGGAALLRRRAQKKRA